MEYQNLSDLLKSDPESKTYFDQLPAYARDQISNNVASFDELKNFVGIFTLDIG